MRRLLLPFAVLLVLASLGSDSPKEYDDETAIAGLDGTWQAVDCIRCVAGRSWKIWTTANRPTAVTRSTRRATRITWIGMGGR